MAGGVTPRQVYQSLIDAGASTVQAIGIMANGIAESSLNPEAVGDQGTSYGTWQQHGGQYAGLVTGNPAKDLNQQVRVLALNGGFRAAQGTNAGESAGNFAANYERCVGCQQGGAQYNQRVANAAVVAGWVASGKWPQSAGSATAAAAGTAGSSGSATSSKSPDCAWGFTALGGGVGPLHLPQLDICFLKKTTIRHMVGGALIVAGGLVALPGVVIVLAYGFRASGAERAVTQVVQVVPGAGRAARAGRAASRGPGPGRGGGTGDRPPRSAPPATAAAGPAR